MLFLCVCVWQDEAVERCSAIEVPKEHCGQRILVKCLSLKWVAWRPIVTSSLIFILLLRCVIYWYSLCVFQVWNRNRANIWNTRPVWCQGKEKGFVFFFSLIPVDDSHFVRSTRTMLSSCLTNRICLVSKRPKWSCSLNHWVQTELKSLGVHSHYHLSFPSLQLLPAYLNLPLTDLGEFLLRPELGSDERAAETTHTSHGHFHPGPLGHFLHHVSVCRYLPGY